MISKTIKIFNHLLKQLTIRQKFVIFNTKNKCVLLQREGNMKKKIYTTPKIKVVDLTNVSVFCGCGGYSSDSDSCYN